ncbi:hypothetical protein FKM82_011180 [Ascaphus truei]
MQSLHTRVVEVEERTTGPEVAVEVVTERQVETDGEISQINAQIARLQDAQEEAENRSRRNHLRIRNIPESVPNEEIKPYLNRLFQSILPEAANAKLELDRAHRIYRPKEFENRGTRDIITRLHYYTTKEEIFNKVRNLDKIPFEDAELQIFSDLAQTTIAKRRELTEITSYLRSKDVRYRWGFPFRLQASHKGKQATLRTPEEGP